MRYIVIVNSKSGTARDRGVAALKAELEQAFADHGAEAEVRMVHPSNFEAELRAAAKNAGGDRTIVAGGGDGSLSAAAGILSGTDIKLGILPLGTMNLMARAISMPLDPSEAVGALVAARPMTIDLMEIGGRTALMHASIGLQPKVIRMRDALPYRTRFARMLNGVMAWLRVTRRLQRIRIRGELDSRAFERRTSAVLISNNALPEGVGETPVSHDLAGGEVAIYVTTSKRRSELVRLALATSLGVWRQSDLVEEFRTRTVQIDSDKRSLLVSVDGEVIRFKTPFDVKILPLSLNLLVPQENIAREGN